MEEDEGYAIPQNKYGADAGLLQYQMDNSDILKEIKRTVLSLTPTQNPEGKTVWVRTPGVKPMLNSIGCNSLLSKMRSRMTKVFALSDFDEETIQKMTLALSEEVIDDLTVNHVVYELRDIPAASAITSMVVDNYYAVLRKAKKGLYLKFLRTSQIVSEQSVLKESTASQQQVSDYDKAKQLFMPFSGGRKKR